MNSRLASLRLLLPVALFIGLGPLAAMPASPTAAAARADDVPWPARWEQGERHGLKGVIVPLVDVPHGIELVRNTRGRTPPTTRDHAASRALLGDDPDPALEVRFEGPGSIIYVPAAAGRPRAPKADFYFKFVSGREVDGGNGERTLEITRTWFAWYDPAAQDEASWPRGTVVLMPGMLGTPEPIIDFVIARLRQEGYGILRMMCQPSRFTERVVLDVDLHDPEPGARNVAREAGERLAECAYAVEAAFDHMRETRPQFEELPRIALGMSGGAMILPTVVAREPDRYDAAILITAGANMMAILEDSNYRDRINAAQIRWIPAPPEDEARRRIDELYLSMALLDPYHTARHLQDKPMLMLHATHDRAVPAVLGDLLWERLGQPERWVEESGHEEMFMHLPKKLGEIIIWLEGRIAPDDD